MPEKEFATDVHMELLKLKLFAKNELKRSYTNYCGIREITGVKHWCKEFQTLMAVCNHECPFFKIVKKKHHICTGDFQFTEENKAKMLRLNVASPEELWEALHNTEPSKKPYSPIDKYSPFHRREDFWPAEPLIRNTQKTNLALITINRQDIPVGLLEMLMQKYSRRTVNVYKREYVIFKKHLREMRRIFHDVKIKSVFWGNV